MKISDYIPERITEGLNKGFFDVLDGLHAFKELEVGKTLRVNNPALLNDNKWLLKRLADYGITNVPYEMPTAILQQVLLNAGTLLRTRGSKIGVELFCSLFSLGQVTLDDSEFYGQSGELIPNSLIQGYITEDLKNDVFYIVDKTEDLLVFEPLTIQISSRYFNGETIEYQQVIQKFLQDSISEWLGFNPGKQIVFNFSARNTFYYHKLLNPYFV